MNKKTIKIIVIIIIAVVITIIATKNLFKDKQEVVNEKINIADISTLLKSARMYLTRSENLVVDSITDESKLQFCAMYLSEGKMEHGNIEYLESQELMGIEIQDANNAAKEIFGEEINFSNVKFEIANDMVYVPIFYGGGDMQIYKYNRTEEDEVTGVKTAYIDCLEANNIRDLENLTDTSTIEYDESDVVYQLVFKYEEVKGKKILLAFNINYLNNY